MENTFQEFKTSLEIENKTLQIIIDNTKILIHYLPPEPYLRGARGLGPRFFFYIYI